MIEGKLVDLRALDMADADDLHAWVNDAEMKRFMSRRYPISRAATEEWIRERTAQPLSMPHVAFAVVAKDGRLVGRTELHVEFPENRAGELDIFIGRPYWSQGYGTDAVRTLVRFAFTEMDLRRVELAVLDFNERAISCYRKCGFVEEARMRQHLYNGGKRRDMVVMGVLRDDVPELAEATR